jgi:peptide/nickel transport system permease protein
LGAILVIAMIVFAIGASLFATHDPNATDTINQLQGPSWDHFFGTDKFGRDVFSRVIWGARTSLAVGFGTVAFSTVIAVIIGTLSGFWGGWFDLIFQRIVDAIMSMPGLVIIITVVAFIGSGLTNLILILSVLIAPGASRVFRGAVLSARQNQYVDAATALGATDIRIITRHILPNIVAPIIIIATVNLGTIILAESALAFLGFGVPAPTASWGRMLSSEGRQFLQTAPWIAIFPGVAITLTVFGFNVLGDALRDVLDPKLRQT